MKIAVTKLKEKSEGIHELFHRYGHEALVISTIAAAPPTDPAPLTRLAKMASEGNIDILIFTSTLGVEKLFEIAHPLKKVRIVSVGPKTAKKVEGYGCAGEVISEFSSEHFAEYLGDIRGKTIGIARAEVPNHELIHSLFSKGATVVEAPAYRLMPSWDRISSILNEADAVIFTSAKSFASSGFGREDAKRIIVIAIGKKTSEAMRMRGIVPGITGDGTLESCLDILNRM